MYPQYTRAEPYVTGINASIIIQIQTVKRLEWPATRKNLDSAAWTWFETQTSSTIIHSL
jgi:hypothetical protein